MRDPSSFRDPSGVIFRRDGVIFRQVNLTYQEHYDQLVSSGLYAFLSGSGLLVQHEEIQSGQKFTPDGYKILKPELVPFVSYPYEWSFSQLKDAALTTLVIQKNALDFGMTLQDASAFNIQWLRGKPVLIDTLSFLRYDEGQPWIAYKQFCQNFLAPLALMSYKHIGSGLLSRIYLDGIPLDVASALLPVRTRLKPSLAMHIHLHARAQKKFAASPGSGIRRKMRFNRRAFLGLIDSLETAIKQLRWKPGQTDWAEYYNEDPYPPEALADKVEVIKESLEEVGPKSVWDLGANTGMFSRIASDLGINVISFDKDPSVIEQSYLDSVDRNETKILPLLLDPATPSPRIGWASRERMNLEDRGPVDMLFALALVHHLAIAGNVPLAMIAEFFSSLCRWIVVEFVPKDDRQVQRLLAARQDVFPCYTHEGFEKAFGQFFEIRSKHRLRGSERTIYVMQKR